MHLSTVTGVRTEGASFYRVPRRTKQQFDSGSQDVSDLSLEQGFGRLEGGRKEQGKQWPTGCPGSDGPLAWPQLSCHGEFPNLHFQPLPPLNTYLWYPRVASCLVCRYPDPKHSLSILNP